MKNFTFFPIFIGTIILFSIFCFSTTAQTYVSGGIYLDTTWTKANSPYIVTDTVVVFPGVTLTIEPGVSVKFADKKRIEIRQANIFANGTITDSIIFTSNSATPTQGIYGGIYINGSSGINKSFSYCSFMYGSYAIQGVAPNDRVGIKNSNFTLNNYGVFNITGDTITNCNFSYNKYTGLSVIGSGTNIFNCNFFHNNVGLQAWHSQISNCVLDSNQTGMYFILNCTINNCYMRYGQYGIVDQFIANNYGGNRVINCTIDSNSIAGYFINSSSAYGTGDSIVNCQIKYNPIGILDTSVTKIASTIVQNAIENNNIGLKIQYSKEIIYCNKICNNTIYNLYYNVAFGNNSNFLNNYWCSTDSVQIDSLIYDGYDNVSLGLVHFRPVDSIGCYLTGCNLGVTATVTNATCDTCHTGSAKAVIANGHPPYTYTWYTSPIQTTQTATGLSSGTYKLCVVDGNGCTACNSNIFVDSTNCTGFHVATVGTNETCFTCSDGSATVNVTGGTAPFTYTWYTSPIQTAKIATNIPHGKYGVCVIDAYGCSACDSVTIGTGNCSAHFNLYPDTIPHTYTAVNMASGAPPIKYNWNWGDGSPHDTTAYPSHTYATAGNYTICLIITDNAGCTNTFCNSYYLQRMENNTMVTVNVVPAIITGINKVVNQTVSIFPNPATDLLTVVVSKIVDQQQFKIYNILGELKYSSVISSQQTSIDISGLANGVYLIELTNENNILRQKFIKQ